MRDGLEGLFEFELSLAYEAKGFGGKGTLIWV
jgi:hypothetical protein